MPGTVELPVNRGGNGAVVARNRCIGLALALLLIAPLAACAGAGPVATGTPASPLSPPSVPAVTVAPTAPPAPTAPAAPTATLALPRPPRQAAISAAANAWLFFGDSITDNGTYPEQVCAVRGCTPQRRSQNIEFRAAIAGTTLQRLPVTTAVTRYTGLDSFALRVGEQPLDTLVVFYGTNDLYYAANPANGLTQWTWAAAWDELFADIARLPGRPRIALVGLPYVTGCPNGGCYRTPPYGAATFAAARTLMDGISEAKARQYGATFVTLAAMTPAMLMADGLHPNVAGQEFIAARLLAALP